MKITQLKLLLWLGLVLCVVSITSYAQDYNSFTPPTPVLQSSPTSQSFDRYTFYPVSHATGVVDISVPLYSLKIREYSLPIELKYHSAGIKHKDIPYPIGYGWQMFPSLRITRQLNGGKADELFMISPEKMQETELFLRQNTGRPTDITAMNKILDIVDLGPEGTQSTSIDADYDMFTISLPNQSGSFILQRNSTNDLSCIPINNQSLTIKFSGTSVNGALEFIVTDGQGIEYYFGEASNSILSTYREVSDGIYVSWMLKKIKMPTMEEITFVYSPYNLSTPLYSQIQGVSMIQDSYGDGLPGFTPDNIMPSFEELRPDRGHRDRIPSKTSLLTQINFPHGKIDFTYTPETAVGAMLDKVEVFNKSNQSVFLANLSRATNNPHFLYSVQIRGQNPYVFGYDIPNTAPSQYVSIDYWGYPNGYSNSTVSNIPRRTFSHHGPYGSITVGETTNIIPNFDYAKTGILNKVTYPTGGHTTLEYELNRYLSNSISHPGPGLRIKRMILYDPISGKSITKEYRYGNGETGNGKIAIFPHENDYFYTAYDYIAMEYNYGFVNPVWASMLRESIYSWGEHRATNLFQTNLPIYYDYVTEYTEEGRIVYKYDYQYDSFMYGDAVNNVKYYRLRRHNQSPRLVEKKIYNNIGQLLQEEAFIHHRLSSISDVTGLAVYSTFGSNSLYSIRDDIHAQRLTLSLPSLYHYHNYQIETGEYKLVSHTVKQYNY